MTNPSLRSGLLRVLLTCQGPTATLQNGQNSQNAVKIAKACRPSIDPALTLLQKDSERTARVLKMKQGPVVMNVNVEVIVDVKVIVYVYWASGTGIV